MGARHLLAALLVGALATGVAWLARPGDRETVFQAPGTVQLLHADGAGLSRDLSRFGGRLRAKAPLWLVFRWLLDPVELEVAAPEGHLELSLGEPGGDGASLLLNPERLAKRKTCS